MKDVKKGRGLAITSGCIFILLPILSSIVTIMQLAMIPKGELNSVYINVPGIIISVLFSIIPSIVLGIMLIIGKLHYGLLVPLLLQGIGLLANWISSIVYFYKIYGDFTGNIILISNFFQMIPLIALIIAIIICIQNIKQSNKSHFITCILPAILRTIVTIIIFLDSYESFKEDQAVLSVIIYILSLLAFIMLGIWLYVSTIPSNNGFATNQFDEQFFTQSVDNQQYFQQPYAVQYAPQYDQQSTMQQPYIQQPTIQEPIQQPTIQQSTLQQPETPQQRLAAQYEAEAIKTYKELLDNGMITQEEYDLKKKQILGI